jgi:preprotein translocase subunit SecY
MSSGFDLWAQVLETFAYRSPFLLVYFVGVVVSAANMRRHRKPAAMALAAFTVLLVVTLGSGAVTSYLIYDINTSGGVGNTMTLFRAIGIVAGVIEAGATGLLIAAVFAGRAPARPADDD